MNLLRYALQIGFVLVFCACTSGPSGSDGSTGSDGTAGSTDASTADAPRTDAAVADARDGDVVTCSSIEIVSCFARWYTADRVGITSTNCVAPSQPCGDGCCNGTCVNIADYPSGMGGGAAPYACFPRGISECPYAISNPNSGLASRVGCGDNSVCSEDGCCPIGENCAVCSAPRMPVDPCKCVISGPELCDGRDNDCNGQTDEGPDSCGTMRVCTAGACACRPEFLCGSTCTDRMTDRTNCGSCGNACAGNQSCSSGLCGCAAGETLCGTQCVNEAIDANHCGSCGNVCPAVARCNNGTCACSGVGELLCGTQCVFSGSDPMNCGACNNVCPGGAACTNGACVTPPPRQIAPLSSTTVASQTPTFRWELAASGLSVHVEICRDRACGTVEQSFDATGTSARPSVPLTTGTHYWRARYVNGTRFSPTWEFWVGRSNVSPDFARTVGGDFNGDGFADVVIRRANCCGDFQAHVHYGASGGLSTMLQVLNPESDVYPINAGDVNGDGFADVVVQGSMGYLYLGGPSGLSTTPTMFTTVGGAFAALGDVNQDGYADVLVGQAVLEGGPSGLTDSLVRAAGAAGDVNGDGYQDAFESVGAGIRLLAGSATGLTPRGSIRTDVFSMAPIGDVNGDGFEDATNEPSGEADVYYSNSLGWGTTSNPVSTGETGFGYPAIGPGDVNGDGYDDAVISAPNAHSVTVYFGSATGVRDPNYATTVGPSSVASFGYYLSTVGDVNGDGLADVVVSSPSTTAFLYFGSAAGLGPNPQAL